MIMETKANTPFYLDKSLWIAVITPIAAIVGSKLGLDLKVEELVGIILPLVTYIVMTKFKSASITVAEVKATAAVNAAAVPAGSPAANLADVVKP